MAKNKRMTSRDLDIKWIEAWLERKKERKQATRKHPLDEKFAFPSTTESSNPTDDFIPAPQVGHVAITLDGHNSIYQSGLFHQDGVAANLGQMSGFEEGDEILGVDGNDCLRVIADKEGLHKWGVSTLMPNDTGQFSVWVYGRGGVSGEDYEYVLSVHQDTEAATPVDEESLVIRWEYNGGVGSVLRLYPDLAHHAATYVEITLNEINWQDADWHKIQGTWSYQDQRWTLKWDDEYGTFIPGPTLVGFPDWDEMTQVDIFTDMNFENVIYHYTCFLSFGPITDPEALGVLSGCVTGEPTGFPNRTDSTLTFTDGTRLFEIDPVGDTFDYYIECEKFTTDGDDITITDVEGMHWIYYVGDTLTEAVNPTNDQLDTIFIENAVVCVIYWDATNNLGIYVGEERHGLKMDGDTHVNLHWFHGLQWEEGLALNTIDADQNGANDTHAQFGVDAGEVHDEDIHDEIDAVSAVTGLNIYYLDGAAGNSRLTTQAGFSCKITGTGRLAWNEWTGAVWQITEVTNNKFVLYHTFATTEIDNPMVSFMGQNEYNNKSAAQAGALTEINDISLGNLPTPEFRPIATIIYQTSNAYGNAVKARIVSTDEGDDYIDWRTSEAIRGIAISGCCSLDASYDAGDTIDYSSGNGPVVLNFPDGGVTDPIAEVMSGVNFNIRNMWKQANDGDILNVTDLYYTETDDITPEDYHMLGITSTDSGTNKYLRWFINSRGIFGCTTFHIFNYPTNQSLIHTISQASVFFNIQQSDIDLLAKSNNRPAMLNLDAANDTIGIDEAVPDANVSLHVGSDGHAATGKGIRNDHPPRARMYPAGAQTNLTANAWTKIEVDTDDYDTDTITDTGNNRITPGVEGYYLVIGNLTWTGGFAHQDRLSMKLRMNNTTDKATCQGHASVSSFLTNQVSSIMFFDSDDFIEMFGRPGTAGNTADVSAGAPNTFLEVHRIS